MDRGDNQQSEWTEELDAAKASSPAPVDTPGSHGELSTLPPGGLSFDPFDYAGRIEALLPLDSYTALTECPGKTHREKIRLLTPHGKPRWAIGEPLCDGISCSQCTVPWDIRSQHELDLAEWDERIRAGVAAGDPDCILAQAVLIVNSNKSDAVEIVLEYRERLDKLRWMALIETVCETLLPRKGGARPKFVRGLLLNLWLDKPGVSYVELAEMTGISVDKVKEAFRKR